MVVAGFTKYLLKETGFNERVLWGYPVDATVACQILANNCGDISDIEESLINRLLPDIGKVAMNNYDVIKFNKIYRKSLLGGNVYLLK